MSINTEVGTRYDYLKSLIIPNGCYFIVRLDGNCFNSYTNQFKRPFDIEFYNLMLSGAKTLMRNISDVYKAHFHSDEVSIYFNKNSDWFDRRLQKIISITAGMLSAKFGNAHFDSRVLLTPTISDVEEYEKDRRLNAFRGCVNSYAYWTQVNAGVSKKKAHGVLAKMKSKERQEFLFQEYGINVAKLPLWQRVGEFLVWEEYEKEGYNPIKKEKVMAIRRRIVIG